MVLQPTSCSTISLYHGEFFFLGDLNDLNKFWTLDYLVTKFKYRMSTFATFWHSMNLVILTWINVQKRFLFLFAESMLFWSTIKTAQLSSLISDLHTVLVYKIKDWRGRSRSRLSLATSSGEICASLRAVVNLDFVLLPDSGLLAGLTESCLSWFVRQRR